MTEYRIAGVPLTLEEIIENIDIWRDANTTLTDLISKAEQRIAGEYVDPLFYKTETVSKTKKRAKDEGEWYYMEEPTFFRPRCDIFNCWYSNCGHESSYKGSWYLKGTNKEIAVCDKCWKEDDVKEDIKESIASLHSK